MKKILLLLISTIFLIQTSKAQNIRISGTITDDKDLPIAGANVIIKGKVTGTVTDANGKFELSTSIQPPFTLVVSSVGYQKQEIEVQNSTTSVTAKLPESSEMLDEVVFAA